ncbi:MAG: hypothetical protein ACI4EX_12305, partial [Lachnospiraceae bacterium]
MSQKRCCTFLAEMMEKYGLEVLRDIAVELQFDPETWRDDAEGKRLRYETYAKQILHGEGSLIEVGCIH